MNQLKEQNAALENENKELKSQLEEKGKEIDELKNANKALKDQLDKKYDYLDESEMIKAFEQAISTLNLQLMKTT